MTKKTKYYITLAVFILAILVVIVCLLSGASTFQKAMPRRFPRCRF